jgi:hypothetical protein
MYRFSEQPRPNGSASQKGIPPFKSDKGSGPNILQYYLYGASMASSKDLAALQATGVPHTTPLQKSAPLPLNTADKGASGEATATNSKERWYQKMSREAGEVDVESKPGCPVPTFLPHAHGKSGTKKTVQWEQNGKSACPKQPGFQPPSMGQANTMKTRGAVPPPQCKFYCPLCGFGCADLTR